MDKQYQPKLFEEKIYRMWERSGAFAPAKKGKPYCIIMPPPNANDPLHVGHAMFVTVEDIFIRYQRMLGKSVLWLPGTDHAGIETQYVFEKNL
ncbi:class I tRNA ligase family protein, partial [Patescibacteria group bacterium]|nr:class I tRNA ligase family protein [Patescibacteria group bacterium]